MFRPLIRIRSQRWACAALRVRPTSPAFAATYGARNGWPPCADEVMMLTIVPGALRATMSVTAACIAKNGPFRLIAMCASNSSGVVSSSVPREVSPAEFTRQSIRPYASTTSATAALACSASARSARTNIVRPPAAASSATRASPGSVRRPVTATAAPSRAAARAIAAPTPWLPPLTRTTLSSRSPMRPVPFQLSRRSAPARSSSRSRSGTHSSRRARRTRSACDGGARPSTGGSSSRLVGKG